MSTATDRLGRIEEVLGTLQGEEPLKHLTDDDLALMRGELESKAKDLRGKIEFRIEAKRRRETLQPAKFKGFMRPIPSLKRTDGQRDPSEIPI